MNYKLVIFIRLRRPKSQGCGFLEAKALFILNFFNMIFTAIEFAARAHAGQFRKGTKIPYIIHPISVAKILIEHGCSDELAIAGVLHDTVEDTRVTLEQIKHAFGIEVAKLVASASEPNKSDLWENRKQHTLDMLKTAPREVLLLVCADKLDNIRSIAEDYRKYGDSLWSRFSRPKAKQKWYFQSLATIFQQRMNGDPDAPLFEEFDHEVRKMFGE
ncbi:MAG: HD domain-containing protein [bacterium]